MSSDPLQPPAPLPINPYDPPLAAELIPDASLAAGPQTRPARPRIWTVFVAVLVMFAAMIAAQVVAVVPIMIWLASQGVTPQDFASRFAELATRTDMFILFGLMSQIPIAATALVAGWMSPVPLRQRLGLVTGSLPAWEVAIMNVGALVPFGTGMGFALALAEVVPPDPTIAKTYEKLTPELALPFILFIALAPGFSEELFFRGYMQRRLIERWPAWLAILVASLIFAVVHIMPHTVVFAFPIGIWLGMMAWKCGAVWPGMICHALINGLWNVWQVGGEFGYWPEEPPIWAIVVLGIVGSIFFAASLWLMFRPARVDSYLGERGA